MISQANSVRAAAAVFLCTGLSIAALKLMGGLEANPDGDWIADMAIVSPLIFLCAAAALVFSSRPNLGHILGGIAAVVALPWFVLTESSVTPSVWSHFNGPEQ